GIWGTALKWGVKLLPKLVGMAQTKKQ
uniref:M-poneritoxin-Ng1d n=1 Tax=Neoponera goeldii TaxID=3057131 RepID=WTX1D_NEOGO|nr:RecName: Full=M-poneritoxin-Ng1d; Short=M-PONTX-Ng1d; AltName: Full=Poneratoxin; AltName: Full=Ponericin-W4 [Neoponera goeldii]